MVDTGNGLVEPISKMPVIVVREEKLRTLLPKGWPTAQAWKDSAAPAQAEIDLTQKRAQAKTALHEDKQIVEQDLAAEASEDPSIQTPGCRMVPYRTLDGMPRLLPAFRPQEILLQAKGEQPVQVERAYVAMAPQEALEEGLDAIVGIVAPIY